MSDLEKYSARELMDEVYKRVEDKPEMSSPWKVASYLYEESNNTTESFWVFLLDGGNHLIKEVELFKGTVNVVSIFAREVFKLAILEDAVSIIVAHNHPGGKLEPSNPDIAITKRLVEAGEILDIKLHDHIIISRNGFYSLNEHGYINI